MNDHGAAPVLLAIDTCGITGSVALGRIERGPTSVMSILATAELAPKTYSTQLLPAIEKVLRDSGLSLAAVSGIVIVNGPGSFTGVRIGVSAAKGLAEGAYLPVLAVSRLELLARQAVGDVCAALDAGRGEFYVGLYRDGSLETEALYTLGELLDTARDLRLAVVVCEEKPASLLAGKTSQLLQLATPTAADALAACTARFQAGTFADLATLDGNYLRRPDAENVANQVAMAAHP